MEIPTSNIYKSIEKEPNIDFSSENFKITFSFDREAVDNLPKVSDNDLKKGDEKYRILLGSIDQQDSGHANILIKGVLEADSKEKELFYYEGKEEVGPNLGNIKKWVKSIQSSIPEYSDFNFIGDIHTHPITNENDLDENIDPCTLSNSDIEDIVREYENGNLSFDKPFIFGVAGRNTSQENTSYVFYRLVKKDGKYIINQIEKNKE